MQFLKQKLQKKKYCKKYYIGNGPEEIKSNVNSAYF